MPLLQLLSDADAAGNLQSEGIVVLKDVALTELNDGRIYFEVPQHIELHGRIDGAMHVGHYRGHLTPNHPNAASITIGKDLVSIATIDSITPSVGVPDDQIIDMPTFTFNTAQSQAQKQLSLLNQRRHEARTLSIRTIGEALRKAPSTSSSSSTTYQSRLAWLKSQYPHPEAAYQLLMIHQEAVAVTNNKKMASYYLGTAIRSGHVEALLYIEKLSEDQLKALDVQKDPRTYYHLLKLYLNGAAGVSRDTEKAKKYLMLYAQCPNSEVPLLIVNGELSQEMASPFLSDPKIACQVGLLYLNGTDATQKDWGKAMVHLQSAADKGDAIAQYQFGMCYLQGPAVEKNPKIAAEYFTAAAKSKDPEARYELAMLKLSGTGVAKDIDEARHLLQDAANQGLDKARFQLAKIYLEDKDNPESANTVSDYISAIAKNRDAGIKALFVPPKELRSLTGQLELKLGVAYIDSTHLGDTCLTSEQIHKIVQKRTEAAAACLTAAKELKNGNASRLLGLLYGQKIGRDITYFAQNKNNIQSIRSVALKKNIDNAISNSEHAMRHGASKLELYIGTLYGEKFENTKDQADLETAINWLKEAKKVDKLREGAVKQLNKLEPQSEKLQKETANKATPSIHQVAQQSAKESELSSEESADEEDPSTLGGFYNNL